MIPVGVGTPDASVRADFTRVGRRWPVSYRSIEAIVLVCDILLIITASILSAASYSLFFYGDTGDLISFIAAGAVVCAVFIPTVKMRGLYHPTALLVWHVQVRNVVVLWTGTFLFLAAAVFALKHGKEFSRVTMLVFAFAGLAFLLIHRAFWRLFLETALASGKLRGRRVIVISDTMTASATSRLIPDLIRHGFQLDRHFQLDGKDGDGRSEDAIGKAVAFARASNIEEVFFVADVERWSEVSPLIERLRVLPLPVNVVPQTAAVELFRRPTHPLGGSVTIEFQRPPLTMAERGVKRLMDIVCSAFGLVVLSPALLMAAIAIKLDSPGPVLFRQTRHGFNGQPFKIMKFRTMTVLEDGELIRQAGRYDERVTRVGAWMRRTSVDELPQLLNVLRGDMALVGPRPHAAAHDSHFAKVIGNYLFRHHMKPGITGWAQVNGYRGETPTIDLITRRIELDTWYVDNWSVWLDIGIMLRTVSEIVRGRNAY